MSEFTIDGQVYETDDLDATQKRVVALYQRALREEGDAEFGRSLNLLFSPTLPCKLSSDIVSII